MSNSFAPAPDWQALAAANASCLTAAEHRIGQVLVGSKPGAFQQLSKNRIFHRCPSKGSYWVSIFYQTHSSRRIVWMLALHILWFLIWTWNCSQSHPKNKRSVSAVKNHSLKAKLGPTTESLMTHAPQPPPAIETPFLSISSFACNSWVRADSFPKASSARLTRLIKALAATSSSHPGHLQCIKFRDFLQMLMEYFTGSLL